jgi:signal transduction histidine kinase
MTRLSLTSELRGRLLPLAVLVVVAFALSGPTAYYVTKVRELRAQAASAAVDLAWELREQALSRPVLWRYDSLKILGHLRAYRRSPGTDRIVIVDGTGARVELGEEEEIERAMVWERAPIADGAGEVWIGASVAGARETALVLGSVFAALAAVLAWLLVWLPLSAQKKAERRIDELVRALERHRGELEGEVRDRVAELRRADRKLNELTGRALALREAERRSIARDLHDGVGQALTAMRIEAQLLEEGSASAAVEKSARRLRETADSCIDEVRRAVELLRPGVLDDLGLKVALERHIEQLREHADLDVRVRVDLTARLGPEVEHACFRIVQEALTNVIRHAGATEVDLSVEVRDSAVEIEVTDDGRGIDPERPSGMGLESMRERAELLGGTFALERPESGGTRVFARLPASAPEPTEPP